MSEMKTETDPNGIAPGEPGAKLDEGKLMAGSIVDFGPALMKVVEVLDFGARKYSKHGWVDVENGAERYYHAMWRHLLAGRGVDPDSGLSHLQHAAWNILAALTLEDTTLND